MSNKFYVMTERMLKVRTTAGASNNCHTCGIEIKVNDDVVAGSKGKRPNRIRHESCARRVGVV